MTLKSYLNVMAIGTCASWIGWFFILSSFDPTRAGVFAFLLFYLTLAPALVGSLSIVGALVRIWRYPESLPAHHVARAFRQAILLSLAILGALMLLSRGLFTWWVTLLFVISLGLLELMFQSAERPRGGVENDA